MRVEEIYNRGIPSVTPGTTLADAGNALWEADCGALPVIDETGKVMGTVTDRDICMAAAVTGQPATELPVRLLLRPRFSACRPSDEVRHALATMRAERVLCLPVVDDAGRLLGILSLGDIAWAARPERWGEPYDITDEDLALAVKTLSRPRKSREPRLPAPSPMTLV